MALSVLGHASLLAGLFPLAILIRFDGLVTGAMWRAAVGILPAVVGIKMAAILATGCHRGRSQDASFAEVLALVEAATLGALGLLALRTLLGVGAVPIPLSVIAIDWASTVVALAGYRASGRLVRERYAPRLGRDGSERVLLVGGTEAGAAIIRAIQHEPRLGLRVVGVVDSDPSARGRTVAGVEVVGSLDDVGRLAKSRRVASVVVPAATILAGEARALAAACREAGVTVRSIPSLEALVRGRLTAQPRDVDPSELLCREPVELDREPIDGFLRGAVVLVTGAAGSIGSEICRQVLSFSPRQVILLDHSENGLFYLERELRSLPGLDADLVPFPANITDIPRLRTAFDRYRPTVVFHAAAHKHVPMMEGNPGEAVKNNVFGTKAVVDESIRAGVASFVLISTDKAVSPSSVMGACKRLAEMYVHAMSDTTPTRLVAVRFGNVIGSAGSVVPVFKQQIRSGGPVTVTHPEMTRYFMTIPEAAQLVLQAGAMGEGGEVFVLEMGKPVRIVDLARNLIRLSGLKEGRDMEIAYSGVRPGEKLHEDLCGDDETSIPTVHPKIVRLLQSSTPLLQLRQAFDRLAETIDGPSESTVRVLSGIVPGYRPRTIRDVGTARRSCTMAVAR